MYKGRVMFGQLDLLVLLIPVGPFYMGWALAARELLPTSTDFYLALLSVIPFLGAGTVLLNDLYDREVDGLSERKSNSGAITGKLSARALVACTIICFAVALVLAASVSDVFLGIMIGLLVLAVLYSVPPVPLSRVPVLDMAANALGIGVLCSTAGWSLLEGASLPPWPWLGVAAFGTAAFFLFPALMDIESDRTAGKQSTAVLLGWRGTCLLGLALTALTNASIVWMALGSDVLEPGFLMIGWPVILGQLAVFPVLLRREGHLKAMTAAMGLLFFVGNVLILLSYNDLLGPF